jgi:hypothetical protein
LLPCGETVCKSHSIEISNKECRFCDSAHVLKKSEQFPANKVLQNLLELKIKELDFGPNHKKASEQINELNKLINDYKSLKEHPDEYVSVHFSKLRNNVDLAREKLILEMNQISDRLLLEIESQENECKANLSNCDPSFLSDDTESIKADLSQWEEHMKYLVVNDDLWKSISTNCSRYKETLNTSRSAIEEKAFGKFKKLKTENDISDSFIEQLTT